MKLTPLIMGNLLTKKVKIVKCEATASYIGHRFRDEIEVLECVEAKKKISEHPKCPFYEFAFTGICEIDMVWYYVAANGSILLPTTQVILLEK